MERKVEVTIWGETVGMLSWSSNTRLGIFNYCDAWIDRKIDLSPICMPISQHRRSYSFPKLGRATFRGLPGMLSDSLPDHFGNQVVRSWQSRVGAKSKVLSPIDQLCFLGKRGMGALEYEPYMKSSSSQSSQQLEIKELVSLANEVVYNRNPRQMNLFGSTSNGIEHLMKVGASAGGARPKAIVAFQPQTGEVMAEMAENKPEYEEWLIKFDGIGKNAMQEMGRVEYAYYLMALDAGIRMMPSKLIQENGRAHFMTKRFDRSLGKKLHTQTLCALGHLDYRKPGEFSYEQAFKVMHHLKLTSNEIEQQYRRMLFNVMGRNQDDHTKNISFIMSPAGKWRLSPAYDMTYGYNPKGHWTRVHRMSINGKRDDFKKTDLIHVGEQFGVQGSNIIFEEVEASISNWTIFGQTAGVSKPHAALIAATHRLNLN